MPMLIPMAIPMSDRACLGGRRYRLVLRFGLAIASAFVAWADCLFWGYRLGFSLPLFLASLAVIVFFAHPVGKRHLGSSGLGAVILIIGLLPSIEEVNTLSFLFGIFGTALFAHVYTARAPVFMDPLVRRAGARLLDGWSLLKKDVIGIEKLASKSWNGGILGTSFVSWVMPICLLLVFLCFFAWANPLIDRWLSEINFSYITNMLSFWRSLFWFAILMMIRPFIPVRRAHRPGPGGNAVSKPTVGTNTLHGFFGDKAILRALVLFNLVFALETGLDVAFLWGEMALPDGVSYAAYAHQGAYPLVLATLIAIVFILGATRPGGPAERSSLISMLILVWTGQNLLLVISSIKRLLLYISAYSLTEFRVEALVWMVLVIIGLILIIIRIGFRRSSAWLMMTNGAALVFTLYIWCFMNVPAVVASYNITHCSEGGGSGPALDMEYLSFMGVRAIPAIDDYLRARPTAKNAPDLALNRVGLLKEYQDYRGSLDNWRSWSFRRWRLERYLARVDHKGKAGLPRRPAVGDSNGGR